MRLPLLSSQLPNVGNYFESVSEKGALASALLVEVCVQFYYRKSVALARLE